MKNNDKTREQLLKDLEKSKKRIAELEKSETERKQAEEEIINSEKKFRILIESAPIGIYYNDLNGTFLYGNKKAEEIIGYKLDELIGKNFLKLKLLYPKHILKAIKLLALNKLGKSTGPDYFTLNSKDGTQKHVEISTEIINIEGQEVVLGMVQDITGRKKTEEELAKHRNHLEEFVQDRTKELEEKNIELKRYNKLFEGRELRIKELRNRVKELEEEAGRREEEKK